MAPKGQLRPGKCAWPLAVSELLCCRAVEHTWSSAAAQAGASPWSLGASPATHIRPFFVTLEIPVLPLFIMCTFFFFLFLLFAAHLLILGAPGASGVISGVLLPTVLCGTGQGSSLVCSAPLGPMTQGCGLSSAHLCPLALGGSDLKAALPTSSTWCWAGSHLRYDLPS